MLYRKAPAQPVRLLLRVIATAGVGALLGAAACSNSSSSGAVGPCGGGPCGTVGLPEDSGDRCLNEAGQFICGSVAEDAACGDDGGRCGLMPAPDAAVEAGEDASGCNPCGTMVNPDAGGDH
jgi:hypothetical protein